MRRGLGWIGFGFVLVMVGCGGASDSLTGVANLATCSANVTALNTAVSLYASDWDSMYPRANTWCDATLPYDSSNKSLYRCPAITDSTQWGYSFVSTYAGKSHTTIANPDTVTLIFESNTLTWNSTQPLTDQITASRHGTDIVVGYADGHVGQVFAP